MIPRLADHAWCSPTASLPPDVRRSLGLVRLSHAIVGGREGELVPRAVLDHLAHGADRWLVLDHACARCACDAMLFEFVVEAPPLRSFAVRVSLADPVAELAEVPLGMDEATAWAVWGAWLGTPRGRVAHWREVHAAFRRLLGDAGARAPRWAWRPVDAVA